MNDKYQKLYQYLSSNGMTDLDMNSFYNEYSSNPNKVKKLYSYLSQNGMTDLDENSFSTEYFAVKKKRGFTINTKTKSYFFGYIKDGSKTAFGFFSRDI